MKKYLLRHPAFVEWYWCVREVLQRRRFGRKDPLLEMRALRAVLRRCPPWALGHARLGLLAIEAYEQAGKEWSQRLLATAELSQKAIESLLAHKQLSEESEAIIDAEIIQSALLFYRGEHAEALQRSELILAKHQSELGSKKRRLVFEQAGASAMSLGMKEKARELFAAIPQNQRSAQGQSALAYLEADDEVPGQSA